MIVWLNVPFAEKDQAKSLGARWSPAQKKWYVKDAADLAPFERWVDPNAAPSSSTARAPVDNGAVDVPTSGVVVYCDGACRGNPGGPGGWGALIRTDGVDVEVLGGLPDTTNNRMELTAAIEALRAIPEPSEVTVLTDSQYVVKGMTEWRHGWVKKNWKDVKNVELWKALIEAAARHRAVFKWVRGHSGHDGNERADALANEGLEHAQRTRTAEGIVRHVSYP